MTDRLNEWTVLKVRALLLGKKINVHALQNTDRRAETSIAVPAGAHGFAVVFPYGVTVLFRHQSAEADRASMIGYARLRVTAT